MELKEAIEHCDVIIKKMDNCECRKEHEELKEFLEELQEYEDTGLTPEQIRELKERDTVKAAEPAPVGYGMICPICGNLVQIWQKHCGEAIACTDDFKSHKYCLNCGQAINWEESEEE